MINYWATNMFMYAADDWHHKKSSKGVCVPVCAETPCPPPFEKKNQNQTHPSKNSGMRVIFVCVCVCLHHTLLHFPLAVPHGRRSLIIRCNKWRPILLTSSDSPRRTSPSKRTMSSKKPRMAFLFFFSLFFVYNFLFLLFCWDHFLSFYMSISPFHTTHFPEVASG